MSKRDAKLQNAARMNALVDFGLRALLDAPETGPTRVGSDERALARIRGLDKCYLRAGCVNDPHPRTSRDLSRNLAWLPRIVFDLEDDPDEREDLASSAAHEEIRNSLTRKVLADWDPEAVIDRMALQTKRTRMISAWVKEVLPDEPIRWKMTDAMNRLF